VADCLMQCKPYRVITIYRYIMRGSIDNGEINVKLAYYDISLLIG